MVDQICSVPDCGTRARARGFCNRHYHRLLRHGDPLGGAASVGEPLSFLRKAKDFSANECLIWPYAKSGAGYGVVRLSGRATLVHRQICIDRHGEPPTPRHEVAHWCGNPACCSPQHLRWATPAENQSDRVRHGTHLRGSRSPLSKLTEDDVRAIRSLVPEKSVAEIARQFKVAPSCISNIVGRRRWKHV
jgi:hypothetical protein